MLSTQNICQLLSQDFGEVEIGPTLEHDFGKFRHWLVTWTITTQELERKTKIYISLQARYIWVSHYDIKPERFGKKTITTTKPKVRPRREEDQDPTMNWLYGSWYAGLPSQVSQSVLMVASNQLVGLGSGLWLVGRLGN